MKEFVKNNKDKNNLWNNEGKVFLYTEPNDMKSCKIKPLNILIESIEEIIMKSKMGMTTSEIEIYLQLSIKKALSLINKRIDREKQRKKKKQREGIIVRGKIENGEFIYYSGEKAKRKEQKFNRQRYKILFFNNPKFLMEEGKIAFDFLRKIGDINEHQFNIIDNTQRTEMIYRANRHIFYQDFRNKWYRNKKSERLSKRFVIRTNPEIFKYIEKYSYQTGMSINSVIYMILGHWVNDNKGKIEIGEQ